MNTDLATTENLPAVQESSALEIATTRSAQEVQAAMIMAKHFPRDEDQSFVRIMRACDRKGLAEKSQYSYPKGGKTVTGPTIRLAEVLAQSWGNIDFGIIELTRSNGQSEMMAYAWDLETNTRQTKIFTVEHKRHTRKGTYALEDPRDIYEMTANMGARRVRACILGIIPGDVVEAAERRCEQTLLGDGNEPLPDRIRSMVARLAEVGIDKGRIEKRLGHKIETSSIHEVIEMGRVFMSIRDGMAKAEQWFPEEKTTTLEELQTKQTNAPGTPPQEPLRQGNDESPAPESPVASEPKAAHVFDRLSILMENLSMGEMACISTLEEYGAKNIEELDSASADILESILSKRLDDLAKEG